MISKDLWQFIKVGDVVRAGEERRATMACSFFVFSLQKSARAFART